MKINAPKIENNCPLRKQKFYLFILFFLYLYIYFKLLFVYTLIYLFICLFNYLFTYLFIIFTFFSPSWVIAQLCLGDDYNDITYNCTYLYNMKIGLDFHFFLQCNLIFYFNWSDIVYLSTVKQLFCVNIDQEKKCSFPVTMIINY